MQIVGSQNANVALLISSDELKPIKGVDIPLCIKVIGEKYNFAIRSGIGQPRFPFPTIMPNQPQIFFQNGTLVIGDRTIVIYKLDYLTEPGIIGLITQTTEEADEVLDDLSALLESALDFRDVKKHSIRHYVSNLIVRFDDNVEGYFNKVSAILKIINEPMKESLGIKEDVKFERIGFGFDPALIPVSKAQFNAGFSIERRVNHPFSENRFFTSAPLKTKEHMKIMEKIGAILEGKG